MKVRPLFRLLAGGIPGLAICALCARLAGQTTAAIDIDTTSTTPIAAGFSGISTDLGPPIEYWDYRFNALAAKISFGWVRFPGGASSDIYSWQSGEEVPAWLQQFASDTAGPGQTVVPLVAGRGGAKLIDAANRANLLGAPLIVCVNGFTDTPQSIGQMAAYVKANQIQVAAWELANEAYLFPGFFATGTDYLNKMKPYRDAIKAADPGAVVAIFIRDPGNMNPQNAWNQAIAAYPNKYWDAISFHYYPPQSSGPFAQWMADENAVLANSTSALVTTLLTPIGPSGVKFLNTEFDPTIPNDSKTGAASITDGTLWGGIYSAEYIMRMSTVPSVLHVGPNEISHYAGVDAANSHISDVIAAANAGKVIDTLSLDFDFYTTAQANGTAVVNSVVNRAVQSNKTTVTGGVTVPATGIAGGIPALYAMSYTNGTGGLAVVITNKSATAQPTTIRVDGSTAAGTFPLQFVSGSDPSAVNAQSNPDTVAIQTGNSGNPVTVPPYSVMRVDLKTPAIATVVNSASYQSGSVAPEELVTAFGSGFAPQAIVASAEPLPATLGDTTISITDSGGRTQLAPLYYVAPSQASFLVPVGMAAGPASFKVMRGGSVVLTGSLTVAAISPGLYSQNGNGAGVAAATYLRASAPNTVDFVFSCQTGVPLSCLSAPISLGTASDTVFVMLYGTGIRGAKQVQAYVAGEPVPVFFAGAQGQYQGLDQINLSLPSSLAGTGEASVYIMADGKMSNMVTIKVQ